MKSPNSDSDSSSEPPFELVLSCVKHHHFIVQMQFETIPKTFVAVCVWRKLKWKTSKTDSTCLVKMKWGWSWLKLHNQEGEFQSFFFSVCWDRDWSVFFLFRINDFFVLGQISVSELVHRIDFRSTNEWPKFLASAEIWKPCSKNNSSINFFHFFFFFGGEIHFYYKVSQ